MLLDRHDRLVIEKVIDALRTEIAYAGRARPFKVAEATRTGFFVALELIPQGRSFPLDETAEESWLSWEADGGASSNAEIIAVIPEVSIVHVCLEKTEAPRVGQVVFLHPRRFLDALLKLWLEPELALHMAKWFNAFGEHSSPPLDINPLRWFPKLRTAQREAFTLLDRPTSFLWGPPGTGKTYTVGRLVAGLLAAGARQQL